MKECQHYNTRVIQTIKMDDGMQYRRRKCKDCGILLHTTEIVTMITVNGKVQKIPERYERL